MSCLCNPLNHGYFEKEREKTENRGATHPTGIYSPKIAYGMKCEVFYVIVP